MQNFWGLAVKFILFSISQLFKACLMSALSLFIHVDCCMWYKIESTLVFFIPLLPWNFADALELAFLIMRTWGSFFLFFFTCCSMWTIILNPYLVFSLSKLRRMDALLKASIKKVAKCNLIVNPKPSSFIFINCWIIIENFAKCDTVFMIANITMCRAL